MDNLSKFSDRLKELMAEKDNIKSDELGNALGIGGSTVRRWLRNENYVFRNQLIGLANYFQCPIDYLVGRINDFSKFSPKTCPAFIERLYQILDERKISTYKLDKNTGIKFAYLTRWRKGTEPHLYSLIELANYLECSIDYLVGLET